MESQEPWPGGEEPSEDRPRRQLRGEPGGGRGRPEPRGGRDGPHGPRARGLKPPGEGGPEAGGADAAGSGETDEGPWTGTERWTEESEPSSRGTNESEAGDDAFGRREGADPEARDGDYDSEDDEGDEEDPDDFDPEDDDDDPDADDDFDPEDDDDDDPDADDDSGDDSEYAGGDAEGADSGNAADASPGAGRSQAAASAVAKPKKPTSPKPGKAAGTPSGPLSLSASCAFGLEAVLARELRALGIEDVKADNGHVDFQTDALGLCRANLWLRTADRVWLRLGTFPATTFEELFEGTRQLPWSDFLPADARFPVDGASYNSVLSSVPACQSVTKKAIVEHLKRAHGVEWFPETGADFRVKVSVIKDQATLSIDTSGTGLHKRGYRLLTTGAPMRETLAAGLILLSYWAPGRTLLDPFCGSGTIPIEAAMIGTDRAPGLDRDFACRRWPFPGQAAWKEALEEAQDRYQRDRKLEIFGSDADPEALRHARTNLARTGLPVNFETNRVQDLKTQKQYGVLITNPPYGERLSDRPEVDQLYREFGEVVRPLMDTWSIYVLTSHPDFVRHFGERAPRKRKLYNGMIECVYYQYPGPRPPGGD